MLLEEVNPAAIEMDITSEPEEVETEEKSKDNTPIIIASTATVAIIATGAGFYFIKKR